MAISVGFSPAGMDAPSTGNEWLQGKRGHSFFLNPRFTKEFDIYSTAKQALGVNSTIDPNVYGAVCNTDPS